MCLVRWGYPYVFDRRSHMTLTDRAPADTQPEARQELDAVFAPFPRGLKAWIVGRPTIEIPCLVGRQHALVGGNRGDATLRWRLNSAFGRSFLMNSTVSIVQSCDSVKRRAAETFEPVARIRVRPSRIGQPVAGA
ncbi:DUF1045 domain-containing protein [Bradyrhizobium sp. S3.3.6]|uniref:DUF1045 domain-containing protein n=1 Tax=Bradyrhizobium sp. S3.3.6 TaxID=3156429 RepID=UPI0033913C9B